MTREEAIEHLKNIAIYSIQDGYTDEARQALDMAIKALEEPHWIPCSERLPKIEGEYLITDDSGGIKTVDTDTLLIFDDGTKGWCYSQNPVAWMPLPESYSEERREKCNTEKKNSTEN